MASMESWNRWCLALTEHWNYTDEGKDFSGGYLIASQGPLVREWAMKLALSQGLWGLDLRQLPHGTHAGGQRDRR
jgi:hypothetical protein